MYVLKEADAEKADKLAKELGIPHLIARVLVGRGVEAEEGARKFLSPHLKHMSDPLSIAGMQKGADILLSALVNKTPILVYGDYDADGVTGTALLFRSLKSFGGIVQAYTPHRVNEGHGISNKVFNVLKSHQIGVMVTVDCGIADVQMAREIEEMGVKVIITDHHTPPPELPPASAVINPHLGALEGSKKLAGVGVAFMLATALRKKLREAGWFNGGAEPNLKELLDLVAIGTVADIVPLTGDNRIFVKYGLKLMRTDPRPGVKALIQVAGLSADLLDVWDIAFRIAPRINAAGRIDHARKALELLLTDSEEEAEEGARELNRLNAKRQLVENEILRDCEEAVLSSVGENHPVIVIASEGWNPGVLGIVAARIVERYNRPCFAIGIHEGVGKGSARAPEGWNLMELLNACSDLLLSYGGHALAAGLKIKPELIDEFRTALIEVAKFQETPQKEIRVDAEALPSELTPETLGYFYYLEPYGEGNPRPLILVRGLKVVHKEKTPEGHVKLLLDGGGTLIKAIAFSGDARSDLLSIGNTVSCIFSPYTRIRNGSSETYLKIVHVENV